MNDMNIFQILRVSEFYDQGKSIDIAKGKYEYPTSMKMIVNKLKRKYRWLRK